MRRVLFALIFLLAWGILTGCAPMITVQNETRFPVRVIVTWSGGRSVLSPSPGESSLAEVTQGAYRATAIPDAEWIEYAKLTRKVLNDQLAHSD